MRVCVNWGQCSILQVGKIGGGGLMGVGGGREGGWNVRVLWWGSMGGGGH